MDQCRVCSRPLFEEPLLRLGNMPAAAQYLPDAGSLDSDKGINVEVRQCTGCGLIQLGREPVPYYREVIRAAGISTEMRDFRLEQFNDLVRRFSLEGKRIVEIGCGRGEFLSILQQCGVRAFGLEYSQEAVDHCVKLGMGVSKGFVDCETFQFDGAPFDAFVMLNFLEHLPDPGATLRGIRANLSEDGIGIVEVPNFDMMLREELFSEFTTDHLLYYTRDTLETCMRMNGFDVVQCDEVWHDYIISAVVRKRGRTSLSPFERRRAKVVQDVRQYVTCFRPSRVAVWGAGHQALALMSLSEIGKHVKYVVDSAPFKQGKYTPATHIPIVSPATLNTDPVDAVVVMAGSYSAEVVSILRQQAGNTVSVAIVTPAGLELAAAPA